MTDDTTLDRCIERSDCSRRGYLATAGALGTGLIHPVSGHLPDSVRRSDADGSQTSPSTEPRQDFLWVGEGLWAEPTVRANLFAFARRHDLAVVLAESGSNGKSAVDGLRTAMEAAAEFDLTVWLNVGRLTGLSAETFVSDRDAREAHLQSLRTVTRFHGELFDGGRVVLWEEAPVMGRWDEDGEWTGAAVENLRDHGPTIFAAQKRAVESVNDALDVGIFVHFPYIVDSKRPSVFPDLVDGLRAEATMADFGFVDFYRGWYEKDVGPGPANDAVRSLITNARAALGDRPVFYLGQSHTINPGHTPSKQAMRMNLRASIDAGAAGLGWYVRNRYVPTESGFDPFVPNVEGADVESEPVNTLTIARDRFLYPWLATFDATTGFDADERFDLWLAGDEFGHYDRRLSLRTTDGEWEYVGDFGGYADGQYPEESAVTHRGTVFRALDRDRFLGDGALQCRIETDSDAADATLVGLLGMPCEPAAYVSERDAAAFVHGGQSLEPFALARMGEPVALRAGEDRSVTIPVTDTDGASLQALRHPDWTETLARLAALEDDETVDLADRFDLWVNGTGVGVAASDQSVAIPPLVDRNGTVRTPADEGIVAATDALVVCHGLRRGRYLADGGIRLARDPAPGVDACYAMPAAGSATFRPPAQGAALLAERPDEAKTFSVDYVDLP